MNIKIEEDEFQQHLKQLKTGNACGPDQLKAETLIHADNTTKTEIRRIMTCCMNGQDIPEEWRVARIHAIHKNGDTFERVITGEYTLQMSSTNCTRAFSGHV